MKDMPTYGSNSCGALTLYGFDRGSMRLQGLDTYIRDLQCSYGKWPVRKQRGYKLVIVEVFGVARILISL